MAEQPVSNGQTDEEQNAQPAPQIDTATAGLGNEVTRDDTHEPQDVIAGPHWCARC